MAGQPTVSLFGSEQQWLATVNVNGVDYGIFDTFSGGEAVAAVAKHRPGGMGTIRTYTGLPDYSDVNVGKVYETQIDHDRLTTLRHQVGRVRASVTLTPLDDQGNPWGTPRVYSGRLAAVKEGKTDSTSNSPRMYDLDIVIETVD